MGRDLPVVRKVVAYIVVDDRVAVFRHRDVPEAGLQVPAGTVEAGESDEDAVLREAEEETGLVGLVIAQRLGKHHFDASPFGRAELHHRAFFLLSYDGPTVEAWSHAERHGGTADPIWFELRWMPIANAANELIADLGAMLGEIDPGTASP